MNLNQLIDFAMLGTEKKTFDPQILPVELTTLVANTGADAEDKLLDALCLAVHYQQAGTELLAADVEFPVVQLVEEGRALPVEIGRLLNLILQCKYEHQNPLLSEWLDLIAAKGYALHPTGMMYLCRIFASSSSELRTRIMACAGERTRYLLKLYAPSAYEKQEDTAMVWEEADFESRKIYWEQLHVQNSQSAWELLDLGWAKESIASKKAFLGIALKNFQSADLPKWQLLYEQDFAHRPKEKKTERECRQLVASALLRSSDTILFAQLHSALEQRIQNQSVGLFSRVLGKKSSRLLELPSENEIWTKEWALAAFGLEIGPSDDVRHQLMRFWIKALPWSVWTELLGLDSGDCISYLLENPSFVITQSGKKYSLYRDALLEKAQLNNDKEFVKILLPYLEIHEAQNLVGLLEQNVYENWMMNNKIFSDLSLLRSHSGEWSAQFGSWLLEQHAQRLLTESYVWDYSASNELPLRLDLGAKKKVQELTAKISKSGNESALASWNRHFHEPILQVFEIREQLQSHRNQP